AAAGHGVEAAEARDAQVALDRRAVRRRLLDDDGVGRQELGEAGDGVVAGDRIRLWGRRGLRARRRQLPRAPRDEAGQCGGAGPEAAEDRGAGAGRGGGGFAVGGELVDGRGEGALAGDVEGEDRGADDQDEIVRREDRRDGGRRGREEALELRVLLGE